MGGEMMVSAGERRNGLKSWEPGWSEQEGVQKGWNSLLTALGSFTAFVSYAHLLCLSVWPYNITHLLCRCLRGLSLSWQPPQSRQKLEHLWNVKAPQLKARYEREVKMNLFKEQKSQVITHERYFHVFQQQKQTELQRLPRMIVDPNWREYSAFSPVYMW